MKRRPRSCCACDATYLEPPYNVLPDGKLVCHTCCRRLVSILRGVLLAHIEGWPTETIR